MAEWQPIETAPKDGSTVILLLSDDAACECPFAAYWTHRSRFGEPGWVGSLSGYSCDDSEIPTHWIPIPPRPRSSSSEEPE